ncbi:alpha/beta hydrolase [Rhodobacteraceae bacterium D3-12]|nr:alpha/beta hydrolase [Rhodobacteraceae bacterium D3-12]
MTLDPALQRMLAVSREQGGPALNELELSDARAAMREMFLKNGYPVNHAVEISHMSSDACGGSFGLHIYRPAHTQGPLPTIVYFHGGGFVLGDAATYDTHSRALAHLLGAAVVFVEYRLAPEHRYPAAVQDTYAVMDYLAKEAKTLGLDRQRIVAMGESAGGNLAVNAALHAHRIGGLRLNGLCLIYPLTDMRPLEEALDRYPSVEEFGTGTNLDLDEMQWFRENYLQSPEHGDLPENTLLFQPDLNLLPPTRIYVGACDPLRDMAVAFSSLLVENDIDAKTEILPGMMHSFMCQGTVSAAALRHFYRVVESLSELLK